MSRNTQQKIIRLPLKPDERELVARLTDFLKAEYKFLVENSFCDVSSLRHIRVRAAEAARVKVSTFSSIIKKAKECNKQKSELDITKKEVCEIIVGVYSLFKKEYDYLKKSHYNSCCLTFLSNIRKRTADAIGTSEDIVAQIITERELGQTPKIIVDINTEDSFIESVKIEIPEEFKEEDSYSD